MFGVKLTMMTVQEMVTAASMPWVMVSSFNGYMMLSSSQYTPLSYGLNTMVIVMKGSAAEIKAKQKKLSDKNQPGHTHS